MAGVVLVLGACVLLACPKTHNSDTKPLSEAEIDTKLAQLPPLPKVHYSWPPPPETSDYRLYQLARITHALCVSGDWATAQQIDNRVRICAQVNKTKPSIRCTLGVNFNPWHRKFGKNLPPTDRGPSYKAELDYFEKRARFVIRQVAESNKKYHSSVRIGAVTLDTERFHVRKGDDKWNEAIREALDAIHKIALKNFPHARIEWFGRGVMPAAVDSGWAKTSYWTGKEIKSSLSCILYSVPEIELTRETFRRTCNLADQMGIEEVTAWVALGAGYRRRLGQPRRWCPDWDYDLVYSWILGAELNNKWYGDRPERFAPYNRAKIVIFYPPPFDKRTPSWAKHFIAYVRGAAGIKDLIDLVYQD